MSVYSKVQILISFSALDQKILHYFLAVIILLPRINPCILGWTGRERKDSTGRLHSFAVLYAAISFWSKRPFCFGGY